MKIHLLMPMAGKGSRFVESRFSIPKPLINIYGKPFFYWATQSIKKFIDIASLDFIVLEEHIKNFKIKEEIKYYFPEARIHTLKNVTEGAVITSLKGIEEINDELPVVFNDCDHLFKCSAFNKFCNFNFKEIYDGILLTFPSIEPKYSFICKDEHNKIIGTVEKKAVSNEAISGCYYFRNKEVFRNVANSYLTKCEYAEFFMSGVYNIMLQEGKQLSSMLTDFHISFGTPEEFEEAKLDTSYKELI